MRSRGGRRVGNQVRINAHLTDAERDAHLWAERFDGNAGDLFALQDDVVRRIAIALNVEIADAEASRPAYDLDAVDCVLRGRAEVAKPQSQERSEREIEWFERALSLDAGFAETGRAWQALLHPVSLMFCRVRLIAILTGRKGWRAKP